MLLSFIIICSIEYYNDIALHIVVFALLLEIIMVHNITRIVVFVVFLNKHVICIMLHIVVFVCVCLGSRVVLNSEKTTCCMP